MRKTLQKIIGGIMEKKLNEETKNKTEDTWSIIYEGILAFASLFAFGAAIVTGEIIWSTCGFVMLTLLEARKIERKISKIEKKIYGEKENVQ